MPQLALVAGIFLGKLMKIGRLFVWTMGLALFSWSASAQSQPPADPAVDACKSTGLLALQERSPEITDLVLDMESLAVSKADTMVGDVPVKTVVLGEAYISRKQQTGKPDRFVCLLGEKGKVLLTFFTAQ